MKTIYLMRHGETLFNVMDVNQGQCDSPLTENGIRQALTARAWYQKNGIHFDTVYCSTAERAADTAELVTQRTDLHRMKGLKEILLGTMEASSNKNNPTYPYGDYFVKYGGESLEQCTERIYKAVKQIADEENGDTVLIVSHGMAIRRFMTAINYEGGDIGFLGNCGIVHLEYEDGRFAVREIVKSMN